MATSRRKTSGRSAGSSAEKAPSIKWPFGKKNYIMFGVALVVIIVGFISLAQGSITLAPLLLVVGYCVLMPIAILIRDHPEDREAEATDETAR